MERNNDHRSRSVPGSYSYAGRDTAENKRTIPWRKKKCTNPVHSRDFAVHSFFERYFRILKIWGKIARYLPISRDISPFYPAPADLGW